MSAPLSAIGATEPNRPAGAAVSNRFARWLCSGLMALWFAYLLIAPTLGIDWIDSWHNEQRVLEIILLALTTLVLAATVRDPFFRRRLPRLHWTVYAVFALGTASALRAPYLDAAFAELALHLQLLVLVMMSAAMLAANPERGVGLLQRCALLLLAVYVAGVAVRYAAAFSIRRPLDLDVLLLGYANARFPSALHALLLPFVATLCLDPGESRLLRRSAQVVLALTWAINLALGTRAIWFAYLISFALLFPLMGRRRLWPLARVMLYTSLAGVLIYFVLFKFLPSWSGIGETFTERTLDKLAWGTNRELLLRSSWEAMRSAPWLGLGPMQFAAIPQVWAAHPHNWILQLGCEWGLPALGLTLYGVISWLRKAVTFVRVDETAQSVHFLAPLVATLIALVYGLVDGNLVMPISQCASVIVFGALIGVMHAGGAAGDAPVLPQHGLSAARSAIFMVILLASVVELSWFAANTIETAMASENMQRIFPTHALWPRFWSDGLLPLNK